MLLNRLTFDRIADHTGTDSHIGQAIYDDKCTCCTISIVGIKLNRLGDSKMAVTNFIEFKLLSVLFLEGIHIYLMIDSIGITVNRLTADLDSIFSIDTKRLFSHPNHVSFEVAG